MTLVALHHVTRRFRHGAGGEVTAVDDVTLDVSAGEFLVVTGPSGSGKSTLLRLIAGIDPPDAGEVRFSGSDVWALPGPERNALRRRHVGIVFQNGHLVPGLDALHNVVLPLLFDSDEDKATAYDRAAGLLGRVGLGKRARHRMHEMSGGQMQRVAVGRALAHRPSLILADEPTAHLDSGTALETVGLIRHAARESGAAVVLVTHNPALRESADRHARMRDGRLVSP